MSKRFHDLLMNHCNIGKELVFGLLILHALLSHGAIDVSEFSTNKDVLIECVASEPLVIDPVAMAFDEHRRMWVAENRAYPQVAPNVLKGQIALLEDMDLDGYYEKRTTFATGLAYPNGVLPWEGGIIVTDAPDVLFMKDTDGDGKCDLRQVLLTGFDTRRSTQLRVNDPTLGPDGWIYLAGGLSGGRVKAPWQSKDAIVDLRRHDVRFHPYDWQLKTTTGKSQYGMDIDRWGNRFICMNRVQVQHVMAEESDWGHNPHFHFNKTVENLPEERVDDLLKGYNAGARIYPSTEHKTTADSHAGTFTAACAVTIYESNGLPETYFGHVFSCDPTGNLIHFDYLEPKGPGFVAKREDTETEFVASRNPWFRPVFLTTGPDGALYVCDMRRKTIEHPDYVPEEIRKRTDFISGNDMGRIYRIFAKTRPKKSLNTMIKQLEKVSPLIKLLPPDVPSVGMSNEALKKWHLATYKSLSLWEENSPYVLRYRFALLLRSHPESLRSKMLAEILIEDSEWEWTRSAVLQSSKGIAGSLLKEIFAFQRNRKPKNITVLDREGMLISIEKLSKFAIMEGVSAEKSLNHLISPKKNEVDALLFAAMLLGMHESGILPPPDTSEPWLGWGDEEFTTAWKRVKDPLAAYSTDDLTDEEKSVLYRFRVLAGLEDWVLKLHEALDLNDPKLLDLVIEASRTAQGHEILREVFDPGIWSRLPHRARNQFLQTACADKRHAELIFSAFEDEILPAGILNMGLRNQWNRFLSKKQKKRLEDLLGNQISLDAAASLKRLQPATKMQGDPEKGKNLFLNLCSSCHRLDQEGHALGPDLFGIRNQAKESILLHIVDPNREIASGFEGVEWTTSDEGFIGLLAFDNGKQIRLQLPSGIDLNFQRSEGTLRHLDLSLMPEGILDALTQQQVADMLAYLRGE